MYADSHTSPKRRRIQGINAASEILKGKPEAQIKINLMTQSQLADRNRTLRVALPQKKERAWLVRATATTESTSLSASPPLSTDQEAGIPGELGRAKIITDTTTGTKAKPRVQRKRAITTNDTTEEAKMKTGAVPERNDTRSRPLTERQTRVRDARERVKAAKARAAEEQGEAVTELQSRTMKLAAVQLRAEEDTLFQEATAAADNIPPPEAAKLRAEMAAWQRNDEAEEDEDDDVVSDDEETEIQNNVAAEESSLKEYQQFLIPGDEEEENETDEDVTAEDVAELEAMFTDSGEEEQSRPAPIVEDESEESEEE